VEPTHLARGYRITARFINPTNQVFILQVRKVTEDDVRNILKDIVSGVFDPAKADLVVTCGGNMVEVGHFPKLSFTLESILPPVRPPQHIMSLFNNAPISVPQPCVVMHTC
jgi:hypothetical protein